MRGRAALVVRDSERVLKPARPSEPVFLSQGVLDEHLCGREFYAPYFFGITACEQSLELEQRLPCVWALVRVVVCLQYLLAEAGRAVLGVEAYQEIEKSGPDARTRGGVLSLEFILERHRDSIASALDEIGCLDLTGEVEGSV